MAFPFSPRNKVLGFRGVRVQDWGAGMSDDRVSHQGFTRHPSPLLDAICKPPKNYPVETRYSNLVATSGNSQKLHINLGRR